VPEVGVTSRPADSKSGFSLTPANPGHAGKVGRFPYHRDAEAQREPQTLESNAQIRETLQAFVEEYASIEIARITKTSRKVTSVSVNSAFECSWFFSALTSVAPRFCGKTSRRFFFARRRNPMRLPGHATVPSAPAIGVRLKPDVRLSLAIAESPPG
jgi:hypothetical protein